MLLNLVPVKERREQYPILNRVQLEHRRNRELSVGTIDYDGDHRSRKRTRDEDD